MSLSATYVWLLIFALYHVHFRHYSLRIKISFIISFQCSLELILNIWTTLVVSWNSMELKHQNLKFHGIPWNFVQIQSSMEFHGTFSTLPSSMEFNGTFNFPQKVPWNSMELFWNSMEFHGIPWNLINLIFKKIIFLNIVVGIWLMIRCYLAKIAQKRYMLALISIS